MLVCQNFYSGNPTLFFVLQEYRINCNMWLIRLSRLNALQGLLFTNSKINKCILNPSVNVHLRSVLRNSNLSSEVSKTELLNTKTKLEKDRLLFYYENPRFYYFLNGFGLVQFFFWVHLSEFTYKKLKEVNVDEEVNSARPFWWQKLSFKDDTTRTLVASFCFFMGKFCYFCILYLGNPCTLRLPTPLLGLWSCLPALYYGANIFFLNSTSMAFDFRLMIMYPYLQLPLGLRPHFVNLPHI